MTCGSSTTRITDWTQAHDLAAEQPEKLAELQRLFLIEAVKYNVLPLDDRRIERFNSEIAGRPELAKGPSQVFFGGMSRVTENTVLNLKNKSYAITAEVVVPEAGANGVIVAQGGAFGGWSLYLLDGVPVHCYNLLGLNRVKASGTGPSPPGAIRSGSSSPTTATGWPKAGTPRSTWTGTCGVVASRSQHSDAVLGRRDPGLGGDHATSVSDDYTPETSRFTGTVNWVQLDQGATTVRT